MTKSIETPQDLKELIIKALVSQDAKFSKEWRHASEQNNLMGALYNELGTVEMNQAAWAIEDIIKGGL